MIQTVKCVRIVEGIKAFYIKIMNLSFNTIISSILGVVAALVLIAYVLSGVLESKRFEDEFEVIERGSAYDKIIFKEHTYYIVRAMGDMVHDPNCTKCKEIRVAEIQEALDGMYD